MRVALVNEGTYPLVHGGVSVWCDHLIRGLPEHDFELTTIVATGREPHSWQLPANARSLELVPLWSAAPPPGRTRLRSEVRPALAALAEAIVTGLPDRWFDAAMRNLADIAGRAGTVAAFHAVLRDGQLPGALLDACEGRMPLTLADVVAAAELIERTLLVLAVDVGDVGLVHAVANGPAALIGLAAAWRRNIPYLLSEHGVYLRERYLALRGIDLSPATKRLVLRFLKLLTRSCYVNADLVLPVSRFNRRWELRHGAHPDKIVTVYNGVDSASYPPMRAEPAEPAISWIGRIDPLKDLETLIRAFGVVRAAKADAKLRLFGPCPAGNEAYRGRCETVVEELRLGDAVTFEGPARGSRPAIEAGQLMALSSISEGMPYTVIEAMMSGRATVNTDVGGVREAVADTGLVVPPRNPRALGAACLELLHDHRRRRELGNAARARALAMFTLGESTDSYRLLYDIGAGSGARAAA